MSSDSIFSRGSSKIRTCIEFINGMNETKFRRLLQRVTDKVGLPNETIFTMDQIEKVSTSVELTMDQVKLLVETIEFMFLQAAYHLVKPAALENELINEQNFHETKAKIFVEQWSLRAKEIVERLKSSPIATHSLADGRWILDVGISQASKSKVKRPTAFYEFQLKNNQTQDLEKLQIEFNKEELYGFFEKLETIQSQLDALMS